MLDVARWLVESNGEQSRRPADPSVCDWQWQMTRRVRQIQNQMRVENAEGIAFFGVSLCCAGHRRTSSTSSRAESIHRDTHTHFKKTRDVITTTIAARER